MSEFSHVTPQLDFDKHMRRSLRVKDPWGTRFGIYLRSVLHANGRVLTNLILTKVRLNMPKRTSPLVLPWKKMWFATSCRDIIGPHLAEMDHPGSVSWLT